MNRLQFFPLVRRIVYKPFFNMVPRFIFVLIVIFLTSEGMPASAQEQQERQENQEKQENQGITNRSNTIHIIDEKPYYLHAVLQGQTLFSIARAYDVEQEDILEENPDVRYGLQYNQVIRIPVDEEDFDEDDIRRTEPLEIREVAPEPRGDFTEHKVQPQETLFGLSQQYGVSIEEILFYNPQAREGLQVDHVLKIPVKNLQEEQITKVEEDGEYRLYNVSPGETKFGISQQFGITVDALERLNPDIREGLQSGQEIRVPTESMLAEREPQSERQSYIFLPTDSHKEVKPRPDTYCFEPEHNDHYQVALLIPLFLEEVDLPGDLPIMKGSLPVTVPDDTLTNRLIHGDSRRQRGGTLPLDHPSFAFLSYYQGALLALDSLREQGMEVTLHAYDVCQQLPKARRATDSDGFKDMDLIIGPFYEETLDYVAAYGRRHDIPVVSPLLPDNQPLRDMPNLFKATPSLETMLSEVANYVSINYPRQNILLVHNNQPGAQEVISAFQDTLLQEVALRNHFYDSLHLNRVDGYYFDNTLVGNRRVSQLVMADPKAGQIPGMISGQRVVRPENVKEVIYRREGIEGVMGKMRPDQKNVLITLISGEPFLSDYLRRLHEYRRDFDISVFGIPEWEDYQSIEIDYLQNLNVHIFTPDFYDYTDRHIKDFVNRYRGVYHTEPDEDAFKGAQTTYFFLNALYEYGKDFDRCMALLNHRGIESPFLFQRPFGTGHGWENTNTSIYRIQDYRRVDVSQPIDVFAGEDSNDSEGFSEDR
ncbi:MAG: LysM peptidoglycan-binding domain-containing protein [Bacteroidales bacterium]